MFISEDQIDANNFWRSYLESFDGKVAPECLEEAFLLVRTSNIGYKLGQIRPSFDDGKWDLLYALRLQGHKEDAVIITGVNLEEEVNQPVLA